MKMARVRGVQTPYCQNFADIEQSIMSAFESIHFKISRQLNGEDWILLDMTNQSTWRH
jgi:hypothetical protein